MSRIILLRGCMSWMPKDPTSSRESKKKLLLIKHIGSTSYCRLWRIHQLDFICVKVLISIRFMPCLYHMLYLTTGSEHQAPSVQWGTSYTLLWMLLVAWFSQFCRYPLFASYSRELLQSSRRNHFIHISAHYVTATIRAKVSGLQ